MERRVEALERRFGNIINIDKKLNHVLGQRYTPQSVQPNQGKLQFVEGKNGSGN